MRKLRKIVFLLLPLVLLAISGCGGGDSGSSGVFGTGGTGGGTTPTGAASPFSLEVVTDISKVDANNGTVLATATLKNASGETVNYTDSTGKLVIIGAGTAVPDQTVTFTVLAGPATINTTAPVTDVNGNAKAIITTKDTPTTTNVLIEAKSTLLGVTYRAYTSIQVVRGTGVITIPANAPSGSPGMLPNLDKTVSPVLATSWCWNQEIPFMLTDSNGNPRVGVPVTLSVYSQSSSSTIIIDFHAPTVTEPSASTVTTDSAGQGIFNAEICLNTPPAGFTTVDSVVYKAVTNDTIPISAYVGQEYSLTSQLPTLTITPSSASFGSSTAITLAIAGGLAPYTVTSSNASRVSVVTSGATVTATLVDNTAWTGSVNISVTDSFGNIASSVLTR